MTDVCPASPGKARRRRRRLLAVGCLALLVGTGCREPSRRDLEIGPGSPPTLLQPLANQAASGQTSTLCGASSPPTPSPPPATSTPVAGTSTVAPTAMLDCAVVPLFPSTQARCPDRFETAEGTPCQFPLDNLEQNLAWTLTGNASPNQPKVLTVYVGPDWLRPVLRATDVGDPWVSVAVCPRDVTGDGLNDLVVTYRRQAAVAKLLVEAADVHTAPNVTLNLKETDIPTTWPEGCSSPVVAGLFVEDDKLYSEVDVRPFEGLSSL